MQIDFTKYSETAQSSNQSGSRNDGPRVGFFFLKNDGDEALVRILVDSPADFNIIGVHQCTFNGKTRNVNCIRTPEEPTDNCPFCSSGSPVKYKIYIPVIEYVRGEDGRVQATARIWERPASFALTLNNNITEYGPLSDVILKIKRSGTGTATTYNLLYAANENRNPDAYPKMSELFEGYNVIGTAVLSRDFQGMLDLLSGDAGTSAPTNNYSGPAGVARPAARTYNSAASYSAPAATSTYSAAPSTYSAPTAPAAPVSAPAPTAPRPAPAAPGFSGSENSSANVARPRRFY